MGKTLFLALSVCTAFVLAQTSTPQNAFSPDQVKWGPAPPVVKPAAQFAVLEGDPTASSGDYTIRLKMPPGFKIAPHWHPKRENVTVISGNFKVGMGDTFRSEQDDEFPSGQLCLP